MDCDFFVINLLYPLGGCSNPCPFLLWIATCNFGAYRHVATLYGSNPCPFLLWIATCAKEDAQQQLYVVTLVHFYCGLRQVSEAMPTIIKGSSNPCPFLLWIATSVLVLLKCTTI